MKTNGPLFNNEQELADWLDSLCECGEDGEIYANRPWEAARVAAAAVRGYILEKEPPRGSA